MVEKLPNQRGSRIDRRGFLKGLLAVGGATAINHMHPRESLIPSAEKLNEIWRMSLGTDVNYDRQTIDNLLSDPEKVLRNTTREEVLEIGKFAQRIYTGISSGITPQQQLHVSFPQSNPNIDLVFINDGRFGPIQSSFGHSDTTEPSAVYTQDQRLVREFIPVIIHELTHGAFGQGEIRANYAATVGCVYAIALGLIDTPELLASNGDITRLWDSAERAAFLKTRAESLQSSRFSGDDGPYIILPIYFFSQMRKQRIRDGRDYDPYSLLSAMDRKFEDETWTYFGREFHAAANKVEYVESLIHDCMRECVHLMKQYNPQAIIPETLKAFAEE